MFDQPFEIKAHKLFWHRKRSDHKLWARKL